MAAIITVDWSSPDVLFDLIYTLNAGEVFRFTKDIETLHQKISDRRPASLSSFKVQLATPGSPYFTTYGDNTYVVIEKVSL